MSAERQVSTSNLLVAHRPESGLKLLRFLERRLGLPPALLHRWLRTGQIRLNGKRAKPFTRVNTGDGIRLPPFALGMVTGKKTFSSCAGVCDEPLPPPPADIRNVPDRPGDFPFLSSIGGRGDIWALYKAPGLPTHGGTGHSDSLAARLAARYADAPFVPVPAHRLDKNTSGALLVAASYEALRILHNALREGRIIKEYLVWTHGRWPFGETRPLRHFLRKLKIGGPEKILAAKTPSGDGRGEREALCLARPLKSQAETSLLQIRLVTGRTHQIRVQLAALGCPVLGDDKYGGGKAERMYLHAARIVLPDNAVFTCPPPWSGALAVEKLPEVIIPASKNLFTTLTSGSYSAQTDMID
ncbi:MAG: RluA family pseudouridine synthase [Desulfovibrio sp.]|jgi:23S rRNA pseudouridine955/2504/2580 synthase|nr:RluA family pseudouridine synthase [Desulfovibrio sp.]